MTTILACAVLVRTPDLTAQQAPTFRARTDVVRIDVVVVDKEGAPIRGLTAADFTVFDRRTPQPIAVFEEVSQPIEVTPPERRLPPVPRDVADNQTARSPRLLVLFVDDMVISPYFERTKQLAREAVERFGDSSLMALLVTSGTDNVEVTEDPAPILAAINRVGTKESKAERIPQRFGAQTSHATLAERHAASTTQLFSGDANGCHLAQLRQMARMVASAEIPRKIFVYITPFCGLFEGVGEFETVYGASFQAEQYQDLIDVFRLANVTLYGLDPRGVLPFNLDQFPSPFIVGADPAPRVMTIRSSSPVVRSQESLRDLAGVTGGFAVTNSEAYAEGFARLTEDLGHYYSLGFYETEPKGGKFHAIDVRVAGHPDATVRFRRGYVSGTPPAVARTRDPLEILSEGAAPVPDLPLRLMAISLPRAGSPRVSVVLEVTVPRAVMTARDGLLHDDLKGILVVANTRTAKVTKRMGITRHVTVPAAGTSTSVSYQVATSVELPPGAYQFRMSARSTAAARAGSVYLLSDVPDYRQTPLAFGGVLIARDDGARQARAASASGLAALPATPLFDRRFTPTDSLRIVAALSHRVRLRPVSMRADLIDSAGVVVRTTDMPPPSKGGPAQQGLDLMVQLIGLLPGPYVIRLTATDGDHTATREVGIVVGA